MNTLPNDMVAARVLKVEGLEQRAGGLTKREYFAALAMEGLIVTLATHPEDAARLAVRHADQLIEALNRRE
jgi:hypothetical protein